MQGAQIRRNEAYLLVRRLGRLPALPARSARELMLVSARERSQAMTEDAAQHSRWSLAERSQAFYEVVTLHHRRLIQYEPMQIITL